MTQEQEMQDVVRLCEDTLSRLRTSPPTRRFSANGKILTLSSEGDWREACTKLEEGIESAKEGMARDAIHTAKIGEEFHHWSTVDRLIATFNYASELDNKYGLRD